jgi:hypothetical protein
MPSQRHFLNLVVHEHITRRYALHQIRLSKNLFYESTENATAQEVARAQQAANAKKKNRGWPSKFLSLRRLPRPEIFFCAEPSQTTPTMSHFFSLLPAQGEGCVMFTDSSGNVSLYDVDMQSVVTMPHPKFPKPLDSITLSIADTNDDRPCRKHRLYVMSTEDGSFELFNHCRTSSSKFTTFPKDWNWQTLWHVPPCVDYTCYARGVGPPFAASPPFAAAMVDSSTIWASSKEGTYVFDMSTGVWRPAGRWMLPFHGAAEYVPEFRLWFGLEGPKNSPEYRLCALDLASSVMADSAPASQYAWDYLDHLHGWQPSECHLVNLDLGRFCIATRCVNMYSEEDERDEVITVLTGVEVVRAGNGIEMIKHKSRYYSHENMGIHCVL